MKSLFYHSTLTLLEMESGTAEALLNGDPTQGYTQIPRRVVENGHLLTNVTDVGTIASGASFPPDMIFQRQEFVGAALERAVPG
jgi:hypothetical protein